MPDALLDHDLWGHDAIVAVVDDLLRRLQAASGNW